MMAAVEKLERAGVKPGAVRDGQMRTLLEEGAREEDESLREKWANLLANGLASDGGAPRAYMEILPQLEPGEAQILDAIAAGEFGVAGTDAGTRIGRGGSGGLSMNGLVNLERLGLVALMPSAGPPTAVRKATGAEMLRPMRLTIFGVRFMDACKEPQPRS
jgi:Abortive infection alpha